MNLHQAALLVVSCVFAGSPVFAQTVYIESNGLRTDRESLVVSSQVGSDGYGLPHSHEALTIVNRTGAKVRYEVHIHKTASDFIWFHRPNGLRGDDFQSPFGTHLAANERQDVYEVYASKSRGTASSEPDHDHVGISAWDVRSGRKLGEADIEVYARFYPKYFSREKPIRYEMWTADGKKDGVGIRRPPTSELPLRVYSRDSNGSVQAITRHSIQAWNQIAGVIGLQKPFFQQVRSERDADFVIDWEGRKLAWDPTSKTMKRSEDLNAGSKPGYVTLGMAYVAGGNPSYVRGIAMRRPTRTRPVGNVAETLMQEFGHMLGLSHSDEVPKELQLKITENDIMRQGHRHKHPYLVYVRFTMRDLAAIAWLFDQKKVVPILSLTR